MDRAIQDISELYELSLAIGNSMDLEKCCETFLSKLIDLKNLSYGAVWIKNKYLFSNSSDDAATLVYAKPKLYIGSKSSSLDHPVFKQLTQRAYISVSSEDSLFFEMIQEKGIKEGQCAIYPLGDIGILKLFSLSRNNTFFTDTELTKINNVILKFAVSLEGCISQQKLMSEIAERKQAENFLRESEEKFRFLTENMGDIIWMLDKNMLTTYVSPSVYEILGFTPEERMRQTLDEMMPPKYAAYIRKIYREEMARETEGSGDPDRTLKMEIQYYHKNGTIVWLENRVKAMRDNAGQMIGIYGVSRDITERKMAEDALYESNKKLRISEENYRFLVNNTPDLIYSIDREGRYTAVNRSFCHALGLESRDIIGKTIHELGFREEELRIWQKLHFEVFSTGNTIETEIMTAQPDGSTRTYEVFLMPVLDEKGTVTSITGTSRDISVRKKMDEEMLKADKLESIGILAGGIAHDFNNYLATLLGNVSLARLYKDDAHKLDEILNNIEIAIEKAKHLANQLFTFAKGSAPVKKSIPIDRFIVDNVRFALSGSNVHCNFNIDQDIYTVEIDEGQFCQVLNNVVLNAVQAMPEGGVIEVTAENTTIGPDKNNHFVPLPPGEYVKISIKDEGCGIPEEYMHKIFDPFFTTKNTGKGLGLAISDSIIKNHGGYISVESSVNMGTKVMIFLPVSRQAYQTETVQNKIYYGTGKILVMDDDEDFRCITEEILSTLGYSVALASDGKEALDLYMAAWKEGHKFDLVIMDLTIPGGMGGKKTMEELLKKDPEARAIVCSGYSNDPVMADFRSYGFKGVIKKPYSLEELSKLIYDILETNKGLS